MLKKLIENPARNARRFLTSRPSPTERIRVVEGSASAELAAEMLASPGSLMQLMPNEARIVVSYMRPRRIAQGTTFIREGDAVNNDFMLLVLTGEVQVEGIAVSRTEPLTLSVLGPGQIVGEMGLLGSGSRSASCTAVADVQGAVLDRKGLTRLTKDDPLTAAKLLMAIGRRLSDRLRDSTDKLKTYAQLTQAMQLELGEAMRPKAPPKPRLKPPGSPS